MTPNAAATQPLGPPPPAAPSRATHFLDPERLPSVVHPSSLACAERSRINRRILQPLRSASTTPDPLRPRSHRRTITLQRCCLPGFTPEGHRRARPRVTWPSLRSHASRASSEQDQIGSRRTGAAHFCGPRGATIDVHYPDPFGSDTFCRELVDPPAGEADGSERFRALSGAFAPFPGAFAPSASPPWTFQSTAGLLSRGQRPIDLLSQAVWPIGVFVTLPREEDRNSQRQGVFHP